MQHTIPSRKRRRVMATLLLGLALGAACSSDEDPIEPPVFTLTGEWSRINSSFGELDGMVVQVNAAQSQAVITTAPPNVYMFQTGDLKWRNIVKISDTEYEFEDLVRQANTGTQSYIPGLITVNADGVSLSISFPTTGTFQDWLLVE